MSNNSLWIVLHKMRSPLIVIVLTYSISIIGLLIIDGVDDKGQIYKMSIFDAFYFISYTASTIGFGETPYEFTYSQKIWVTFCIYFTVIGWLYAVGSFLALLQNEILKDEIARLKFKWKVNSISRKFIIIFGFNEVTNKIIKKLLNNDIIAVVIEKDKNKANNLILENYTPTVPILVSNAKDQNSLIEAGIKYKNCKAVVSLFKSDDLNLNVALKSKLINKKIRLAIRSSSENQTENLEDINTEIIINIFDIISKELKMLFNAPNLLKIEQWIYKIDRLNKQIPTLPKGKYIICGYGRLGKSIYKYLKDLTNIELYFIEIDNKKNRNLSKNEKDIVIFDNADDKNVQIMANIKNAKAILAFTNNNTTNISIIATAKKLNPNIITMAREDDLDDISIFENAKIDYLFITSKIIYNKTIIAIISPLSNIFLESLTFKDELWAQKLIKQLIVKIGEDPLIFELEINKHESPQIYKAILNNIDISLDIICTCLYNKKQRNNIITLLILRDQNEYILPNIDFKLKINDKILFACDQNGKDDIEYIAQNIDEFKYVTMDLNI